MGHFTVDSLKQANTVIVVTAVINEIISITNEYLQKVCELARIRTWNLLIRSQTRYPLRHEPHNQTLLEKDKYKKPNHNSSKRTGSARQLSA